MTTEQHTISPGELRYNLPSRSILRLARLHRISRRFCLQMALRFEGGEFFSGTARMLLKSFYGVSIGAYSYGECFKLGSFRPGVKVGRYVSIGPNVRAFSRNHPTDRLSTHPFFYDPSLGLVTDFNIPTRQLQIEHDSWLGAGTIVTAGCGRIGIGAIIGAGSIVTKDVPDFSIVAGSPARLIRMRFEEKTCELIRRSRWWERSWRECAAVLHNMIEPLERTAHRHPLLQQSEHATLATR